MLTKRTRGSLAQFLAIFETDFVLVLCGKHGLRMSVEGDALLTTLNRNFTFTDKPEWLLSIVEKIARTQGDLRARINPKFRFKERLDDLTRCLPLDRYIVSETELSVGVEELDQEKLTPLLRLTYHDSISDAIADLGQAEEIGKVFAGFQKYLYQPQMAAH